MRVLIVEDVGFVRHNMERLLTQQGHAVVTALSGEQALEKLKADHKIQVVITDLFMSGIGGIDLFREAQKIQCIDDSGRPSGPGFILTTTTERSSGDSKKTVLVQQALDIGFVDVLLKPIDAAQLTSRLQQLEMNNAASTNSINSNDSAPQSNASSDNGPRQADMLQEIRSSLSHLQNEINNQIQRLDTTLETIEAS